MGAETLEFTFVLLPLLATVFVLLNVSWAIFSKSTLQRAVRVGVRHGVTITSAEATGGQCLTDMVKATVQANSLGLLAGTAGLARIKVNYIQPPAPNSNAAAVDVSTQVSGNTPGNIMQVSVQNYSLLPLVPLIFSWNQPATKSPLNISVYSADRIEPSRTPPCIGTAP
jgi:Flp pilus assembly protein TadG